MDKIKISLSKVLKSISSDIKVPEDFTKDLMRRIKEKINKSK